MKPLPAPDPRRSPRPALLPPHQVWIKAGAPRTPPPREEPVSPFWLLIAGLSALAMMVVLALLGLVDLDDTKQRAPLPPAQTAPHTVVVVSIPGMAP